MDMPETEKGGAVGKPKRSRWSWVLVGLVLFILLGDLSNLVSNEACEKAVLRRFIAGEGHGKTVHLCGDFSNPTFDLTWYRLQQMGAKHEVMTKDQFD
jgi:hypothetical protein